MANQSTAAIALWIGTMYLFIKGKAYVVSLNSSDIYDTYDCHLYFKCKIGFNIPLNTSYMVGAVITVILTAVFFVKAVKNKMRILK